MTLRIGEEEQQTRRVRSLRVGIQSHETRPEQRKVQRIHLGDERLTQNVYEKASNAPAATPALRELLTDVVRNVIRPTATAAQIAEKRFNARAGFSGLVNKTNGRA